MSKYFKAFLILLLIMIVTTFAVKNNVPVRLNYYFHISKFEFPLYALIYATFFIGVLIGMAVGITQRITLWRKMKKFRKEAETLGNKVAAYQPEPAKGDNAPEERKKDGLEQGLAQLPAQRPYK